MKQPEALTLTEEEKKEGWVIALRGGMLMKVLVLDEEDPREDGRARFVRPQNE